MSDWDQINPYGGGPVYGGVTPTVGGNYQPTYDNYANAPGTYTPYTAPTPYNPTNPAIGWANVGTETGMIPTTPVRLDYTQAVGPQPDNYGVQQYGYRGAFQPPTTTAPNPYGDLNRDPGQFPDPTGGAGNGTLYPGGDYNDLFNVPYTNPYGNIGPVSQYPGNPYGDLSGVLAFNNNSGRGDGDTANPYGDLSGAGFPNPYGGLDTTQTPGATYNDYATRGATWGMGGQLPNTNTAPPNVTPTQNYTGGATIDRNAFNGPYGGLTNTAATGGADLNANNPFDLGNFQGAYNPQPQPTIDTTPQNPAQPYQTPTTAGTFGDLSGARRDFQQAVYGAPYGDLSGVTGFSQPPVTTGYAPPPTPYQTPTTPATWGAPPVDVAPPALYDQNYMDANIGPWGSLLGGEEDPNTTIREGLDGTQYPNPSPPIYTGYQNPGNPLVLPVDQWTAASGSPMRASQYFAQNVTPPGQQYQTAFGDIGRTFDLQGSPFAGQTDKATNRVPQTGGFVGYGSQPNYGPAQTAISQRLVDDPTNGGQWWWMNQDMR